MQIQVEQTFIFSKPGDAPPSPYSKKEQRRRKAASDACWAKLFKELGPPNRVMAGDEK